ncbi:hypothetical protein ACF8C6_01660 [Pseudomonas sp. zbq_18]|uniref:hypothetical protein n=1 Tax=Pseudomonas sp. zbq_18 TaxID=3367251 RepID=UPI00370C6C78
MSQQHNDLQHEQQLLQHFRQHSPGEPSTALDARILAAAHQAVAATPSRPGFAQRLHAWLFGAGSNTRWSLAFAGLATLGIGLSLTLRTQEQVPGAYDLPSPAAAQAPVLREMAPKLLAEPAGSMEQKKAEVARQPTIAESSAAFAISPPAAAMPRQAAPAAPAMDALADTSSNEAEAPGAAKVQAAEQARARTQEYARRAPERLAGTLAESAPLSERLQEVVRLRQEGQQALAEQLLQHLTRQYPQQDVPAELRRLQRD